MAAAYSSLSWFISIWGSFICSYFEGLLETWRRLLVGYSTLANFSRCCENSLGTHSGMSGVYSITLKCAWYSYSVNVYIFHGISCSWWLIPGTSKRWSLSSKKKGCAKASIASGRLFGLYCNNSFIKSSADWGVSLGKCSANGGGTSYGKSLF